MSCSWGKLLFVGGNMHDLARRSLDKLEEAWQCHVRANELTETIQKLYRQRDQLTSDAGSLRIAVKILARDGGPATEDDVEALQRAFAAFEMERSPREAAESPAPTVSEEVDNLAEQIFGPQEAPIATSESKESTPNDEGIRLLDAVDDATENLSGEFKSGDVRQQLERLYPTLLGRVHKASITGTLAKLVELGRLERVTPGGRGREGVFKKTEGADRPPLPPKRSQPSPEELIRILTEE